MKKLGLLLLLCTACATEGIIGVAYNKNRVVQWTLRDSPAREAGIDYGDELVCPSLLKGPVGTKARVIIKREEKLIELYIERKNPKDMTFWY